MQKKIFWMLFMTLGLILDLLVPLVWGIVLTIPALILSWWVAYKSGWFE